MEPQQPSLLSDYAELCLNTLAASPLAGKISLGGAVGLMHYFAYRTTYDVDAWWEPDATHEDQQQIINLLSGTLEPYGEVKTRSWGDVVSIELYTDNKKAFSFQIAHRTILLNPTRPSPWAGVKLDSLDDLIASKMVALVERGAPRDFLDIYTLCQNDVVTAVQCWRLWRRRQQKSQSNPDSDRASLALQTHLARIEQHRPLERIAGSSERESAQLLRRWFKTVFMEALDA